MSAEELPSDVREALREAHQELAARADGHLPMATRRALRRTLAREPPSATEAAGPARVLTRLDELCVLRALPAWIAERPGDERPQRALALAWELREGQTDFADVKLELDEFDVELDDLGLARTAERAWAAGQAAVDTAYTAEFGDYYGSDMPQGTDDEGLDPYGWAVDFLTCLAEAPSFPRDGVSGHVESRRAFWRWYLDEAAPEAWRTAGGRQASVREMSLYRHPELGFALECPEGWGVIEQSSTSAAFGAVGDSRPVRPALNVSWERTSLDLVAFERRALTVQDRELGPLQLLDLITDL